eukprot:scaffold15405_cov119-Isochrysis_galbana.AAC.2
MRQTPAALNKRDRPKIGRHLRRRASKSSLETGDSRSSSVGLRTRGAISPSAQAASAPLVASISGSSGDHQLRSSSSSSLSAPGWC